MNLRLAHVCIALWIVGLFAMAVLRALFDCGPGELPFEASLRLSAVGGVTYCLLGCLALFDDREEERQD
jgi:hypothetical protein